MTRDRSFYKLFFGMLIVLALQNVITLSVNLLDNIMLGSYSEAALSGAAAINQIQFFFQQVMIAFGESIVVLNSQYFGKKESGPMKKVAAIGMHTALIAGVVLFVLATVCPYRVVSIFSPDKAIIEQGVAYLRVIRWTYLIFPVTQTLLATLRSEGIVRIALGLSISTLVINFGINYTLIFGNFGAPRLGITGAAVGTLTARIAELAILVIFLAKREKFLRLRLFDFFRRDRVLAGDYIRVMWPLLVAYGLSGINVSIHNAVYGHISPIALAANGAANPLYMVVKAWTLGAAATATFIVGKTIGEGLENRLKEYARTMQVLFLLVGIASCAVLFLLRTPVLSLYRELTPETRALAGKLLGALAFIAIGMSYEMAGSFGIVRGGGDTKWSMKVDLVSVWCIVIPSALLAAFVFHAPVIAVFWLFNSDQIFKGLPVFLKLNFGHWAKKLTRTQEVSAAETSAKETPS